MSEWKEGLTDYNKLIEAAEWTLKEAKRHKLSLYVPLELYTEKYDNPTKYHFYNIVLRAANYFLGKEEKK